MLVLLSYLYDYKGMRKYKSTWYNITMWIYILLAGLRYRIGSDTIVYEEAFNEMPVIGDLTLHYLTEVSRFEYGFTLMMSLIKTIFNQFWILLLIQSFITNYCIFKFFKENTSAPYVAAIVYFIVVYYFINCEAARQGIAVGIFLFSWKYFANNKWGKYIAFIVIASLFHISAIIFLILPFIKILNLWERIKPSPLVYTLLICILFSSLAIGHYFSKYLIILELSGIIGEKADAYFNYSEIGHLAPTTIIAYLFSYVLLPLFFLSNRKLKDSTFGITMVPMILFSCMINLCGGIPMMYRLAYYLSPFYIVGISDSIFRRQNHVSLDKVQKVHTNKPDILLILMLMIYLVYKSQMYFVSESNSQYYKYYMRFYPYNSVIDKGVDPNREGLYRK